MHGRSSRPSASWIRRIVGGLLLLGCAAFAAEPAPAPPAVPSSGAAPAAEPMRLHLRFRERRPDGRWTVAGRTEAWNPQAVAIIVCDMWDSHHSHRAALRTAELVPRMNRLLEAARGRGSLIVHAPSGCMAAYENHPARKVAQSAAKPADFPADIGKWCYKIPAEEGVTYPLDQSDGGADDAPEDLAKWHATLAAAGRNPKAPWQKQIDGLRIDDRDAISDSGEEIWALLAARGVKHVLLCGVHTNMCVLGRPFGLRQMAKNGRQVALLRDLTDTMYNPARAPYVNHFVGTDLIVEHIEKVVCPTVESTDVLGGTRFRFAEDRRRVLFVIGEDEYKTETTLPEFARRDLEPAGFDCRFVFADAKERDRFPKLAEEIAAADLIFVSVRRRLPEPEAILALRKHLTDGKPLIGIRTANHAFSAKLKPPAGEVPSPREWRDFDAAVFGGSYVGHHGVGPKTALAIPRTLVEPHPILTGLAADSFVGNGSLYRVRPVAPDALVLLEGTIPDHPTEPIAWIRPCKLGPVPARIFYTSLGHPQDFEQDAFRTFLRHAVLWSLDLGVPQPLKPR